MNWWLILVLFALLCALANWVVGPTIEWREAIEVEASEGAIYEAVRGFEGSMPQTLARAVEKETVEFAIADPSPFRCQTQTVTYEIGKGELRQHYVNRIRRPFQVVIGTSGLPEFVIGQLQADLTKLKLLIDKDTKKQR
eukprot:CAMPEP_0118902304 /NCGR_PEP_ID=MMETSP1166-20130328/7650_1 /TAXON_ID=1104430 /ORGANISM="Chrysoreinhardia sp, Strain CCMP3193" /LENGTH=138 /DNA_ID=CAMNT_0006841509 /DNA_START=37 /DNA_END=453 /DNA_ORIENTATION=+